MHNVEQKDEKVSGGDFLEYMKDKSNIDFIQQQFDTDYFETQGQIELKLTNGRYPDLESSFNNLEKILLALRKIRAFVDEKTIL